jgi:Zn-dependent peptidase ImmA (M78 family)
MQTTMADFARATAAAQTLLQKHEITEPRIPVFQLAESEGLKLLFITMPDNLKDVSGFLDFEKKSIYINTNDPPKRQVFTAAHELGHWTLHQDRKTEVNILPRFAKMGSKDPVEQEANCFAAHLLVPLEMLRKTIRQYQLTKEDSSTLSMLFGVSEEMMKFQLQRV